jgi:ABC-type Zn uptake system ZnuABC Zn-binding protein ZnuA
MAGKPRSRWVLVGVIAVLAGALPFLGVGCGGGEEVWKEQPGPKVVVSFAPLYCFAANVAGDNAQVKSLMTTSGPHDFNPTDTEARLLRKADLLFINGLGLDDGLAETLRKGSSNRKLNVVALGKRIPEDQLREGSEDHDHHAHGHHHEHEGGHDPHVWLSPDLAALMTEGIRDELKKADPGNAAGYDQRAAEYVAKLRKLKADGQDMLKGKADRKLVTFHESLAYFARDFDLTIAGVVEKKPGVEPTSDELTALIKKCQENKVRLIAVEPQYGANTSAKTLLDEVRRRGVPDAELVEIDPLETVIPAALTPGWYEEKMRANLAALRDKMK